MILLKSLLFESVDTIKNVQSIIDIFNSNTKLSDIGTIEQYSHYVNTIFPDSEVKDILYHGSKEKNHLDDFDETKIKLNHEYLAAGNGFYFTEDKLFAQLVGDKITYVVLNLENPAILNTSEQSFLELSRLEKDNIIKNLLITHDGIIDTRKEDYYEDNKLVTKKSSDYIVYDKNQIHILGSKQDVLKFKKFVSGKTKDQKEKQTTDDETQSDDDFSLVNIAQDIGIIGLMLAGTIINLLTPEETNALEKYPSETTNGNEVMKFFLDKGLSIKAAAGITGNLQAESESWQTGNIGDNGTSMGLAQWHNERLVRMIKWTMENGYSPKSVNGQLEYLWYDLTTRYTSALTAIKNAKTASDAAVAFAKKYEKPATISPKRGNYAEKYYKQYTDK